MNASWYHASPSANRDSIQQHGLLAQRRTGIHTTFAIPGQPAGLYLSTDAVEVDRYVWHVFKRWFPDARVLSNAEAYLSRGARLARFDVWQIEAGVEKMTADSDWPGRAQWTSSNIEPARLMLLREWSLKDYATDPDRFRL